MKNIFNNKLSINKTKILNIGLIISIYYLFRDGFEKLIGFIFVDHFFIYFHKGSFTDLIICLFLLCYIIYFFINQFKIPLVWNPYYYLLLSSIIIYLYYRMFDSNWYFFRFSFFESIAYLDVIFISISLYSLNLFKYDKNKNNLNSDKGFILDSFDGIDITKRKAFAKNIIDKINYTDNKSSFAIGIIGEYGSGKSVFLKFLKDHIDPKESIIINFNPWNYSTSTILVEKFFFEFTNSFKNDGSILFNLITDYSKNFIDDKTFGSLIKTTMNLNYSTLENQLEKINNYLEKLNKRIFIFIDDLDRLDKNEIIEVLKLIRNTANFKNTVFIVTYDREYILNSIKGIIDSRYKTYLDKIFQIEIPLPKYEDNIIGEYLIEMIESKIPYTYKNHITNDLDSQSIDMQFNKFKFLIFNYIINFRDVKRFANSFTLIFNKLEGEIKIVDLFIIELVKLKYVGIYELFSRQKQSFLVTKNDVADGFQCFVLQRGDDKIEIFKSHLQANMDELRIREEDIDILLKTFHFLFPSDFSNVDRGDLSIAYPQNIEKYFYYRLSEYSLSEKEFLELRQSNTFIQQIDDLISRGLGYPLLERIYKINDLKSIEDCKKILNIVFHIGNKHDEKYDGYFQIENNYLFKLLKQNDFIRLFGNELSLKKYLIELFSEDLAPSFVWLRFLNYINLINNKTDFYLDDLERDKILFVFLVSELQKEKKFTENIWRLIFLNITLIFGQYNTVKNRLKPETKELIQEFILQVGIDNFIQSNIITQATPFDQKFKLSDRFYTIFETKTEYNNFISQHKLVGNLIEEMNSFLEKYSTDKNDSNGIEYNFTKIKPYFYG